MRSCRSAMKVSDTSEPRDVGARDLAAAHVHAAPFRAAVDGGHGLARIEDAVGIERALHVVESRDLGTAELLAHLPQLLDSHAVLAGDRPAHLDAELEDASAEFLALLEVARHARVVEDARVDVAVARVEDVAPREAVVARPLGHAVGPVGQATGRDRAVDRVVVGMDGGARRERALARLPEVRALGLVLRRAQLRGPAALE